MTSIFFLIYQIDSEALVCRYAPLISDGRVSEIRHIPGLLPVGTSLSHPKPLVIQVLYFLAASQTVLHIPSLSKMH